MPFVYLMLYGLAVKVESIFPLALPGRLIAEVRKPDVCMTLGTEVSSRMENMHWIHFYNSIDSDEAGEPEFRAFRDMKTGAVCLKYGMGLVFSIDRSGSCVDVRWPADLDPEELAPALLGPVMGVLLRLRGGLCLHASAVAIDGLAVGLVGSSGAGKSTTAAAFARLGFPVLCDDVLALRETTSGTLAVPAYPRVRLWPESAAGLFGSADLLPRMTPTWDKRVLDLDAPGFRFQDEPLPLGALIFLNPRGQQGMEANKAQPKRPAEALMQLVSDSFATNFQLQTDRAREFDQLSRLVQTLPLRQISAPADIGQVDSFCEAIVRDVRKQRVSQPA